MTAVFTIALCTLLLMTLMSLVAYRTIAPGADRLTMQWSLSGKPNWTLPRLPALCFMPMFAAVILGAISTLGAFATGWTAAMFVAAHAFHLFLLKRRS